MLTDLIDEIKYKDVDDYVESLPTQVANGMREQFLRELQNLKLDSEDILAIQGY